MNYRLVSKLLSFICLAVGVAFCGCALLGMCYGETVFTPILHSWFIPCVATLGIALIAFFMGRRAKNKIFRKEALCVVGLGWVVASALGAIPFCFLLPKCSYIDAFFETAAGFTTTGSTVFGVVENFPKSLMFWRTLTQWFGGLGVVVFFVAILSSLGAGGKMLYSREASGQIADFDVHRIQKGLYQLIIFYVGLSAACVIAFKLAGISWFDAFCHMFGTVATGGLSTRNESVGAFNNPCLEWMFIIFMFLGAVNFLYMIKVIKGNKEFVKRNEEVPFFTFVVLLASAIICVMIWPQFSKVEGWEPIVRKSLFQVVSLITTTGFSSCNFDVWVPATHTVLICIMFIGGCSGSTAGGIKAIRCLASLKILRLQFEKSFRTHVVRHVVVNGKVLDEDGKDDIGRFFLLVFWTVCGSIIFISICERHLDFESVFSAVATCLFNVGPGLAKVGPMCNFGFLSTPSKALLSFLMILGRLEFYAIIVLFLPSFWRKLE